MMKPILLLFTLLGTQVSSVKNSVVQGTVKDLNGAVIWHALVQISKPLQEQRLARSPQEPGKSNSSATLETDAHGKFSTDLSPGLYQVCVSGKGFMKTCRDAQAEDGKAVTLDFSPGFDPAYMPAASEVMDQRLRKLAGPTAIACGHVKVNASPKNATACVRRAFSQGKPFYVRYDVIGIDAEIAGGLVSKGSHNAYAVSFDSIGLSTEGLTDSETMPDGSHTVVTPCPKPVKIRKDSQGRATCFKKNQKPRWILDE
jgi:hypothetical protein